jgi:di/tricarboxylate transporter
MTFDQVTILVIGAATLALFLWGRFRHDLVALAALLACVVLGVVPASGAFAGFGHPAVITVASVLILSRGLLNTGAIDAMTRDLIPAAAGPLLTLGVLTGLAAVLSAVMNNVGALAVLMPVALQAARRQNIPAGRFLMPVAFGSILGGMTTLIGTPPNLIVSGFRAEVRETGFGMFAFTPVGAAVAVVGVIFIVVVGWRLVPSREGAGDGGFDTGAYLTEARVPEDSRAVGKTLEDVEEALDKAGAQVIGLIRNETSISAPSPRRRLRAGDIVVIEAEPESLASALSSLGLKLEEDIRGRGREEQDGNGAAITPPEMPESEATKSAPESGEIAILELVVRPDALLIGRSASDVELRTRYGINLLAVSRQGRRSVRRLRAERIRAGDVLLMQGPPKAISGFAGEFGCIPLAERAIRIPDRRRAALAIIIMAAAVAGAVFGLLPAAIAFATAVLLFLAVRIVPPRTAYEAVDWPVIVLLAALIPVAGAMATTGTADLLATLLLEHIAQGHAVVALALLLIVTMTLSDFMNNAATAAVMCPLAISAAAHLEVNPDTFLMAVAVGASCAFLTPIGHQNNTLILGPGGFRFGDYWRLGLPMEIIVVAVGIPMLLLVWPL